jgi:hypothetical protein
MFNILNFFSTGVKDSLKLKNNGKFSHNGPYILLTEKTLVDRWHIGDIGSAEYTLSADLNISNKEIVKCLITATTENANIVIYARNSTNISLINLEVRINESYLELFAEPTNLKTASSKLIYTVNYFQNQNPL